MTEPHKLQREALAALHRDLTEGAGRGVVVMPCGAGKTLLGRWFAEQTAARLTVVFVPSLALVPQTLLAYRADTSWRHEAMIVCSDESSGRAVTLEQLGEHGLPDWARRQVCSSTSQRLIAEFVAGPGPRLIVSTYHSAPKVAGALAAAHRHADLLVCDEAHRLAGRPRREFRAVLEQDVLPARRRLFLTATPVEAAAWALDRADEVDELGVGGDRPLTLDDTDLFGRTVYAATFGDAVTAGRLVDYDVAVLAAHGPDRREASALHAVLTAAADGATRLLSFHSRVAGARDLAAALDGQTLPDGRTVHAEHVEARHRAPRRSAALGRLANPEPGTVRVLCSARTLSEGVDVPAVDTVVFADARSSPVDIVQAVGRAMRVAPGKDRGRVVLTVDPGDEHDTDTLLTASKTWQHVWITLRALASMDERFAAQLRGRATADPDRRITGGQWNGPQLSTELPDSIDFNRWLLRCLDRTGLGWWASYDALADWARQRGHARPQPRHHHLGVAVGKWVGAQRTAHRAGYLSQTAVDALEALPGWAWSTREQAWWSAAQAWVEYRGPRHLDRLADIPGWPGGRDESRPTRGYATLAAFAVDTAGQARRGELPAHLAEAAAALDGWRWDLVDHADGVMVDALGEYRAWKGDLNPPHDYIHDGLHGEQLRLGAWLTAVRRRRYTDRLDPALLLELEALDAAKATGRLRWERAETAWRLGYLALRQWVDREGTPRTPYEHVESLPDVDIELNRWCVVQRQSYRLGKLAADRVAALEAVSGWTWSVDPHRRTPDGQRTILDNVEHGTRSAYVKGCQCNPCTEANRTYARRNDHQGTDRVDAAKARGHLRMLEGRGCSRNALARATGLNDKTIDGLLDGRTRTILPETDQTVRALTYAQAQTYARVGGRWGELVDATETHRLIADMVDRGWPKAWISREMGGDGRALQLRKDRVSRDNADAVAEVHRRLRGREAPQRRSNRHPDGPEALPTLDELDGATSLAVAS